MWVWQALHLGTLTFVIAGIAPGAAPIKPGRAACASFGANSDLWVESMKNERECDVIRDRRWFAV
jgi:hypothetical protein